MIGLREIGALLALMLIVFLIFISPIGGAIVDGFDSDAPSEIMRDKDSAAFTICDRSPRINCIVDGDTFWYERRKIRIADINTPEVGKPLCAREAQLGHNAKARLYQLLNAGNFSLARIDRDTDYYGRDLRIVMRGGQSLGDVLISEGLAHKWKGRKESWC